MMILCALALAGLPRLDASEVPFRMGEDAIIVDATVNDKSLSLLFDTGFSGAVVADQNIDLGAPTGTMNLRDFVGAFQAHTVKIKSFKLGAVPVTLSQPEVVQQPMAHMTQAYNTHTDGILGFQAIEGYVTEINFEQKKFIFHPKSYDITQKVPDNKKTFLLKMLPIGIDAVVLPVVAPSGKKLVMSLDTGNAFYATTHRDVLERVGLWDSSSEPKFMSLVQVASGPVKSWNKKMDDMTIFGVPVSSSYWDIIDLPAGDASSDGTVGIGFLRNFNVTIDFDRRRVWLDNYTGQVANDPTGGVGIVAIGDKVRGYVRVAAVSDNTPASKAGIKVDDKVLEIDGQELAPSMTYQQLESKLKGKPGSKVELAISHEGTLTRYEFERVPLYN